ncbi:hypothetical protein L0128_09270 [candidate division KSB1 bacterium]|nr:hypothetical protein [candidate division KSB1 bacterium]
MRNQNPWLRFSVLLISFSCLLAAKHVTKRKFLNYAPMQHIQAIKASGDDLWIGTFGGLVRFHQPDSTFKYYQMSDGLPGHNIRDLEFDANGKLWAATDNGICTFSDEQWTVIDTTGRIPSKQINCIEKDQAGDLWFGTNNGICTQTQDNWRKFNPANSGLAGKIIQDIDFDDAGHLWVASLGGLTEYTGTRWLNHGLRSYLDVRKIAAPDSTRIYVSSPAALQYRAHDGWHSVAVKQKSLTLVNSIVFENRDRIWFGNPAGLWVFENEKYLNFFKPEGSGISGNIQCLFLQSPHRLWVGFRQGLARFDGKKKWTTLSWRPPLPLAKIRGLGFAGERLYAGTEVGMFYREQHFFNPMHWSDGDSIRQVTLMKAIDFENFYFVTSDYIGRNRGLALEKIVALKDCPIGNKLTCLWPRQNGDLYCGSGKGLVVYRNGSWTDPNFTFVVNDMIEDTHDCIWLATNTGAVECKSSQKKLHLSEKREIYCIAKDQSGFLWFGGDLYLYQYYKGWEKIRETEENSDLIIKLIAIDQNNLVYGSEKTGFFIYDQKGNFTHYTIEDGLLGSPITCIVPARDGSIWFGSDAGISCLLPESK